jgi:hypothetical protein
MSDQHLPAENGIPPQIICRKCGVINEYHQAPGKGPHHACLICSACGHFIQWLAQPKPLLEPTKKQIDFLRTLGHQGKLPPSRKLASEQIGALLKAKGMRHV